MDRVAAELHQACRDVGFFMVKGHGKPFIMFEANTDRIVSLGIHLQRWVLCRHARQCHKRSAPGGQAMVQLACKCVP